ncbi:MAG TPA: carboxypeptidase-like regulatory domain-containing protein, partial [Pyrinomonadaceae bacterium]
MSHRGLFARSFTLVILLAAASCLAQAQTAPGRVQVRGQVVDTNHDRVTGATVTCSSTRFKATIVTDERGEFATALPPDEYAINVSAEGFAESTQKLPVTYA